MARMHSEYCTSEAWSGGVRFRAPARSAAEAPARYALQGAVPLWTALESDPAAIPGMETLIPPWASIVGSGWPGSPWLRMQTAHCTSKPLALPFGGVAPLDVDVVALRERELVAVAVLAGLGVVELVVLLTEATLVL